jgi:hypothetical protein
MKKNCCQQHDMFCRHAKKRITQEQPCFTGVAKIGGGISKKEHHQQYFTPPTSALFQIFTSPVLFIKTQMV